MASANSDQVKSILDALFECAQDFSVLLDQESDCLSNRSAGELEETAARKRRLSERIDQLSNELTQTVPVHDNNLSESLPPSLRPQWSQLRSLLREVQEKNQLNGQRVMLQDRQVDAAMAILQGSHEEPEGTTYGSDGHKTGREGGHRHVKV